MAADPDVEAAGEGLAARLRAHRDAARLTQADLADLAGVSVRTVRDIERGRTSRVQQATAVQLADALALTEEDRQDFLAVAWGKRAAIGGAAEPVATAGPPDPLLFGRDREVARLVDLLTSEPVPARPAPLVLSLVGVAGVGKSALAQAVVRRLAELPQGVVEVQVSPGAVAATLARVPATRPAWLVLDAVDRAPAEVRAALATLPPVHTVLTTGRGPLGLPGERIWPVGPLELPPASVEVELAEVARYPAVALLLDRLAQVRLEPPAADEVPALVGLVRRLGGLPLALELAAGHGRLLRLPQILARYGHRVLDLGAGLRPAVASSCRLLDPAEQRALRRLAAFQDRWSAELAEQLLATEPGGLQIEDPVPLLDRLVSLGLVTVRGVRENRFRLLEVVREFATEQAEQRGELAAARRAHARVIVRLAERTAPELASPGLAAAAGRLDDLAADVWTALNHSAGPEPGEALRLAASLVRWWRLRGWGRPGRQWLRRLLADPRSLAAGPAVRAWAQLGLAQLAYDHGQGSAERATAEAALAGFRQLGEVNGELAAARVLSGVAWVDGRYEQARGYTEAALQAATRAGQARAAMLAQHDLFWHEVRAGDLVAARRRLAAVDRLAAQAGDQRVRVKVAASRAEVARLEGRYEEAVLIGRRVLARIGGGEAGDPAQRRRLLGTVGRALASLGRSGEAERVLAVLRAEPASETGVCAVVEGLLAQVRQDPVVAAEWFAAAATEFRAGQDRRGELEALACLAACTIDPVERQQVRAELAELVATTGFALLPAEQARLGEG